MRKTDVQAELHAVELAKYQRDRDNETASLKAKITKLENRLKLESQERESDAAMAAFLDGIKGDGGRIHKPYKPVAPSGKATAVIAVNDIHAGELVDPATVNGLNEYTLDVCENRLAAVGHNALRLIESKRTLSHIRDLVVWFGGDMMTGHIHEELAETNPFSPIEEARWCKYQLIGLLDYWKEFGDFDSVTVVTSYGNHGRTTHRPRIGTAAKHSYEWGMYHDIADIYAARGDNSIQFKIERSYFNWLDIQGKQVRFQHGDWLKYQGGVGGVTIPMNKALNEWNKAARADFDFIAHWHQFLRMRRAVVCNCLMGYNAFAQSIKAEFSEPSQTLVVFDRDRPLPVSVDEIFCDYEDRDDGNQSLRGGPVHKRPARKHANGNRRRRPAA